MTQINIGHKFILIIFIFFIVCLFAIFYYSKTNAGEITDQLVAETEALVDQVPIEPIETKYPIKTKPVEEIPLIKPNYKINTFEGKKLISDYRIIPDTSCIQILDDSSIICGSFSIKKYGTE